jgi:hypothetical protein
LHCSSPTGMVKCSSRWPFCTAFCEAGTSGMRGIIAFERNVAGEGRVLVGDWANGDAATAEVVLLH